MSRLCDTMIEASGSLVSDIAIGQMITLSLEIEGTNSGFHGVKFFLLSEVSKETKEYFPSKENTEMYFVIDKKLGGIFIMYLNDLNEVEIVSPIPFEE